MRILIRTSKWAIWARRLGSFAIPMVVIPLVLHRSRQIESDTFIIIEAVAAAIAVLALISALIAYGRLWVTGDQGWLKASWGLAFALVCLAPFAFLGAMSLRYPRINEVSTNFADPVPLSTPRTVPATDPALAERIRARFPNATSRAYPLEAPIVFDLVGDLATEQGWDLRTRRAPLDSGDSGAMTAMAMTLFGFVDEVAIRVRGTAQGATVDMRSVPVFDFWDFGSNGQRVEEFLLALDKAVTAAARSAPQGESGEAQEEAEETGDAEATTGN